MIEIVYLLFFVVFVGGSAVISLITVTAAIVMHYVDKGK